MFRMQPVSTATILKFFHRAFYIFFQETLDLRCLIGYKVTFPDGISSTVCLTKFHCKNIRKLRRVLFVINADCSRLCIDSSAL